MQSTEDRRRLLSRFNDGPVSALAVVLRCAAGFLILLAVVAGPWPVLEAGHEAEAIGNRYAVPRLAHVLPRTAHAKRVFDERRVRYFSTQGKLPRM